MISKQDMDILQVNAYYNNFYLLEVKNISKDNPIGVCLCRKCHKYNFFPLKELLFSTLKDKIKCRYCSAYPYIYNAEMEQWKKEAANEKKQKEELLKQEYKNNKILSQEKAEKIKKENTEKLQARILSERKNLTEDQKQYLDIFNKKTKGSQGEKEVSSILLQNNIPFVREKTFPGFKYDGVSTRTPRFDFYVNDEYVIEFNGSQHYKDSTGHFKLTLEEQQKRDQIKIQYCLDHNIPIIVIPYTKLNHISIEDLLPITSEYLVS